MKEITRIHIAKISYEIEVDAKKTLEAYMKSLEAYSDDEEMINDVEIRMTELLAERGVKKDGVIGKDDVVALKVQLGEPRDFMGEGDIAVGPDEEDTFEADSSRKLYRDTDNAVLGGVLSGIGAFFKINPVWVRLIFILLALASLGTMVLVYIVLWIAVPPARTAADKLQMSGRPVTLHSIREINESEMNRPDSEDAGGRRVLTMLLGIASVGAASLAAVITAGATMAALFGGQHYLFEGGTGSRYVVAAFILAVVSGVLLTTLFILTAYASFAQKMTRRVLVAICIVIVAGLVSFGAALGTVQYGSLQRNYFVDANTRTQGVPLPEVVKNAKSIEIDSKGVLVKYVATTASFHANVRGIATNTSGLPKVTASVDGTVLRVSVQKQKDDACVSIGWWCQDATPTLEIYGPTLDQLTAKDDSMAEYKTDSQKNLTVTTGNNASVTLLPGTVDSVTVDEGQASVVSLTRATVSRVKVSIKSSSNFEAGTVQSLDVADQQSCPSDSSSRVSVWNVTSGSLVVNGNQQAVKKINTGCTKLVIEKGEE